MHGETVKFNQNHSSGLRFIIIIIINSNWVITRWQWLFYMYTNMGKK